MKKRAVHITLAILCVFVLMTATVLSRQQRALSEKMIRLHVVANSDTEEDQAIKLKVRDAVLQKAEQILTDADDPKTVLGEDLDEIRITAAECLDSLGCKDPVTVRLGKELFPTREYDTFSLPAGVYESLRVTIGSGDGRNWWCVVFPSICVPAGAEDLFTCAASAGFKQDEIRLITTDTPVFEVKFKTMELIQEVKNLITGMK